MCSKVLKVSFLFNILNVGVKGPHMLQKINHKYENMFNIAYSWKVRMSSESELKMYYEGNLYIGLSSFQEGTKILDPT